jgi:3-methyladenine DNA glycosylase AlkD
LTVADPDIAALVAELDAELRAAGDPVRAVAEKRYLKSRLDFAGVGLPAIRTLARSLERRHATLSHAGVVAFAAQLWDSSLFERRMCTVEVLRAYGATLTPGDAALLERLIRESGTWALVDSLAGDVVSGVVERHPELVAVLDRWAVDGDFWVRRSAMLALLPPLRRGGGDFARFAGYADAMLEEREFFIRKAIGWVLREVGKRRPELVVAWLRPRLERASGLTVREAVRHLPAADREALLALRRRPPDGR